ncbi:MAG: SUMF1/EgtB/PvdO family nonheme iron enzyme [Polyangiaceae bacterium]|nr:SUMF1/EgtB/PvdO family nonheme iron enzyme [Polyangiaceae bacterium]
MRFYLDIKLSSATSCALLVAISAIGCGKEEQAPYGHVPPTPEVIGARITIGASKVTIGFDPGALRAEVDVAGFRISKHPVTVDQVKRCTQAGACDAKLVAACEQPPGDPKTTVALCVDPTQAQAYCAWVGAKLPSLPEWFLAARGPSVTQYPWGNNAPTCSQHPAGVNALSADDLQNLRRQANRPGPYSELLRNAQACQGENRFSKIHAHPEGASPTGMEDVLLSDAELMLGSGASPYNLCADATEPCLVTRNYTAQIAGLSSLPPRTSPQAPFGPSGAAQADQATAGSISYAFRCVWIEGAE